jgi:hypothetical protein
MCAAMALSPVKCQLRDQSDYMPDRNEEQVLAGKMGRMARTILQEAILTNLPEIQIPAIARYRNRIMKTKAGNFSDQLWISSGQDVARPGRYIQAVLPEMPSTLRGGIDHASRRRDQSKRSGVS